MIGAAPSSTAAIMILFRVKRSGHLPRDGQGLQSPQHEIRRIHQRAVGLQAQGGQVLDQHLERNSTFEPRQRRTQTVVDTPPKTEMVTRLPPDIEAVRLDAMLLIAI